MENLCYRKAGNTFIYKIVFIFIIFVLILTAGCFNGSNNNPTVIPEPESKNITLYTWREYTDKSVLDDFEKETGIKVNLREYGTTPMMLGETRANPAEYDVIIMEGYIVSSMKDLKLIEELNLDKIPNYKNIKKELLEHPKYEHQGKYSVPYLWGTIGLVYNTNYVKENINSWKDLLDEKYKGHICLMDDPRNAMTVLLKMSGYSLNSKNQDELNVAEKNALLLKKNGVIFGDTMGNVEKVVKGEVWIAQAFNGDVFYKANGRKGVKFVNPKEGFNINGDYICISSDSNNKEGAYRLINYFLRPDIGGRLTNKFYYVSPVEGAEKYTDEKILNNPIVYPSGNVLVKGESFIDLGSVNNEYERIFNLMK